MKDKELVKLLDILSKKLSSALQNDSYEQVNILYDKLSVYLPDDFNLYKGWFDYLLFNYESYIDTETGMEPVFLNAITKCRKAEEICKKEYLSTLCVYEYKLIDTLTEYDDSYFGQFTGNYQLQLLSKTIQLDPHNIEAYEKRGNIYFALGEKEEAKKDFDKIEELSSEIKTDDFQTLNLAFADELLNEEQKAILKYEKILKDTTITSIKKICCENLIRIYTKGDNQDKIDYYEDFLDNL